MKVIDNAKEVQDFYLKMYKNLYLRKKAMVAQRMLQKMVHFLIQDGELSTNSLHELRDFELLSKLQNSKNETVKKLFPRFLNNNLFKEAIVIRYESFADSYRVFGKPIRVFGVPPEIMDDFITDENFQAKNPTKLLEVENAIAKVAGIPEYSVLIIPVVSPDRFKSKDVKIYHSKGSLEYIYPIHHKSIEEYGQAYATFRVCVFPEYREKLSEAKMAKSIYETLLKYTQYYVMPFA